MSIIRGEEENLNAAIWHMERAFEVQPSNQAIQDELKHLYGRRDGQEPTKDSAYPRCIVPDVCPGKSDPAGDCGD